VIESPQPPSPTGHSRIEDGLFDVSLLDPSAIQAMSPTSLISRLLPSLKMNDEPIQSPD
jgi:hypothetical protein